MPQLSAAQERFHHPPAAVRSHDDVDGSHVARQPQDRVGNGHIHPALGALGHLCRAEQDISQPRRGKNRRANLRPSSSRTNSRIFFISALPSGNRQDATRTARPGYSDTYGGNRTVYRRFHTDFVTKTVHCRRQLAPLIDRLTAPMKREPGRYRRPRRSGSALATDLQSLDQCEDGPSTSQPLAADPRACSSDLPLEISGFLHSLACPRPASGGPTLQYLQFCALNVLSFEPCTGQRAEQIVLNGDDQSWRSNRFQAAMGRSLSCYRLQYRSRDPVREGCSA